MLFSIVLAVFFTPSLACGGFFCSNANPVVQEGENILFSMKGDQVRATIQIKYQGSADDFSWVLPLPSTPDFEVSSDRVFSVLHAETDPTFNVKITKPKGCDTIFNQFFCELQRSVQAESADAAADPGPKVEVLKEGDIGPFTYKVIAAREEDTDGQDLFDWLNDNGYDQPPAAKPIVARYVKNRHRFVTLKLQKGKEAGELVPIVLKYKSPSSAEMSCIPLRLTAIAAADDMPVFAWIAGDTRAVPNNFVHLVPDMSELPWKKCLSGANGLEDGFNFAPFGGAGVCVDEYQQMLKDVAAEYGIDRWMTTEFAGPIEENLLDMIWNDEQPAVEEATLANSASPGEFLSRLINLLRPLNLHQSPLTQEFLKRVMPKPNDVRSECENDAQFYGPWPENPCIKDYVRNFDSKAVAKEVMEQLIQPLIDTRENMAEYKYLTRMYTSISPEFMDRDPIFRFSPAGMLPDVSHQHEIELQVTDCPANYNDPFDATLVYPNGKSEQLKGIKQNGCQYPTFPNVEPIGLGDERAVRLELLKASGESDFEVVPLADKAAAVELDATLLDDVVGLDFDADTCNAGSKGCECGRMGMCSEGLECQTVRFVEVCDVPQASSSLASLAVSLLLMAILVAL